jgi:hypothetical protein
MNKPAFARLPFGHWSRVLAGQIKRRHYAFVIAGKRVVGFQGWAVMNEPEAEAWVTGMPNATEVAGTTGDCVVINAWAADAPEANRLLLQGALTIAKDYRMLYAKREYPNGRTRPMRLRMQEFLASDPAKALGLFYLSSRKGEPS